MKRLLLIFLFSAGCSLSSTAQIIDQFAATAAVNYSAVYSSNRNIVREPLYGWELGIVGEKDLMNSVKISTGMRLARIRFGLQDVGASQVTYLGFPIDLKVVLPLNLFLQTGLRFDIRVGHQNARRPVTINGSPGYMGDGFASFSDSFIPGWTVGAGKIFNFNGFKPWIEVRFTKDFNHFSGYDGLISMYKNTGKVIIGIPLRVF